MRAYRVRSLLMGGQACVFYGAVATQCVPIHATISCATDSRTL
ncbi:MAG TPA: hypothetical protein VFW05_14355 [Verrucomicrobiae bacterium]|nr:hypothetical protein [Verrucomicrobiae bacterium]